MYQTFLVLFLIVAITLVILIIVQHNKSNNMGGMFDNRSLGNTLNSGVFNNGINRIIVILGILFFLLSLLLGNMNSKQNQQYIPNDSNKTQL